MLLALLTNNVGILWVAMEAATLTTVLLVSLYRTPASLEAAWKYFILCGVGIAQALFGTILLYFAAEKVLGAGGTALLWTHLNEVQGRARADRARPRVRLPARRLRHEGRPRAAAQLAARRARRRARRRSRRCSRGCCSTSRSTPSCARRCSSKARSGRISRGNLMMGFGLLSVVVAAFLLSRQKDIKRLFAYSSIEHMGLMTFAFGMGGPLATFAGPAAHDGAFAHQVGDLLRGRPCRAEVRYAGHGGHPRADRKQSRDRLGLACSAPSRSSACRRSACSRASSCCSRRRCTSSRGRRRCC